jgi:RNA polymerase sigma-70 factor (ECF subfamily)
MNDPKMDTITHHRMPLTIGLMVEKMLNSHLSVGTGLQYSRLYSETQEGNTYSRIQKEQRLQYLGIPLRLSWYPVRTIRWSLYGTAQTMLELPLHSTLQRSNIVGGLQVETERLRLSPSAQWSLGVGAGLEYRFTPVIGIYAEPSLQYFFKTSDGLDSYRTAHPVNFSIPFGIRITF